MLQSTETEIALGKLRTELRALQATPPKDDATEAVRAEHDEKLTKGLKQLDDLEIQKSTALKAEDLAVDRARRLSDVEGRVGAGDLPNIPSEFRSFMGLEARCSLEGFYDGVHGIETTGAEREMREALGIVERGVIPWPMLIEPKRLQEIRQEQRAALAEGAKVRALIGREFAEKIGEGNNVFLRAAFGAGNTLMSMQDPIIQDVFGASTAAFLMTRFSSAGIGDALELVLTSTGAGATADRTARVAGGSLAARTLKPKPIRATYDINKTDLMRFRGLESSLRADLPRAINDVVDANVLNGTDFTGSILARAPAGVNANRGRNVRDRHRSGGGGHRRQVRPHAEGGEAGRQSVNDDSVLRPTRVEHGGHAPGLLHDELRRHHDDEQHAREGRRHCEGALHLQDRTRRDVQRRSARCGAAAFRSSAMSTRRRSRTSCSSRRTSTWTSTWCGRMATCRS